MVPGSGSLGSIAVGSVSGAYNPPSAPPLPAVTPVGALGSYAIGSVALGGGSGALPFSLAVGVRAAAVFFFD